jgi:hypothetical protein
VSQDKTEALGFPFDSANLGFNTSEPATAAATADAEEHRQQDIMVVKKENIPLWERTQGCPFYRVDF